MATANRASRRARPGRAAALRTGCRSAPARGSRGDSGRYRHASGTSVTKRQTWPSANSSPEPERFQEREPPVTAASTPPTVKPAEHHGVPAGCGARPAPLSTDERDRGRARSRRSRARPGTGLTPSSSGVGARPQRRASSGRTRSGSRGERAAAPESRSVSVPAAYRADEHAEQCVGSRWLPTCAGVRCQVPGARAAPARRIRRRSGRIRRRRSRRSTARGPASRGFVTVATRHTSANEHNRADG